MSVNNPVAFPITPEIWGTHPDFHGMSLRDWFAGQALQKCLELKPEFAARRAYEVADAMLAERSKLEAR